MTRDDLGHTPAPALLARPAPSPAPSPALSPRPVAAAQRPSRRAVARAAAWAVPTVVAATAVPAFAASSCSDTLPEIGFGSTEEDGTAVSTAAGGWTQAYLEGDSGSWRQSDYATKAPGFRNRNPLGPSSPGRWYGVGAEPSEGAASVLASKDETVTLSASCSYQVSAEFTTYEGDSAAPTVTIEASQGETTLVLFELEQSTGGGSGRKRTNALEKSEPFNLAAGGKWTFQIRFVFENNTNANDVYIRNLELSYA